VHDPDQDAYELIVNTTAVGLRGEDPFEELPLATGAFDPGQVVVDMVYGAEPSRLLGAAETAGATTVDGIEVLIQQGGLSFRIWTGRDAPLDVMRTAARG
jgi:shikimate dehydrogenase